MKDAAAADPKTDVKVSDQFLDPTGCNPDNAKGYLILKKSANEALSYRPTVGGAECSIGTAEPTQALTANAACEIKKITLRSPQGMLYFLGVISRNYINDGPSAKKKVAQVRTGSPLFVVTTGAASGNSAITASYDGETYGIPRKIKDRGFSMMAINLISQVITLQKDPKSIPKSTTINIISN